MADSRTGRRGERGCTWATGSTWGGGVLAGELTQRAALHSQLRSRRGVGPVGLSPCLVLPQGASGARGGRRAGRLAPGSSWDGSPEESMWPPAGSQEGALRSFPGVGVSRKSTDVRESQLGLHERWGPGGCGDTQGQLLL